MPNPTKKEISVNSRSAFASSPNRPLMIGNMSPNQLNCFLSIRRFEEENSAKIGESGELAKTLTKEADIKMDFLNKNDDFVAKEYFKFASQIKVPAAIPLNLPDSAIQLIKDKKLEKIVATPEPNTRSVKIAMVDKNGWEKILVTGHENYFKNHPLLDIRNVIVVIRRLVFQLYLF